MSTKIVIFGLSGDLGVRHLLPALHDVFKSDVVGSFNVIGVSRREVDPADLLARSLGESCHEDFAAHFSMSQVDYTKADDYITLKNQLALDDTDQALLYLSVPPHSVTPIAEQLGRAGLNAPNIKIMFEKPFGVDLESAKKLFTHTGKYFTDKQTYRVDHFAAKEMARALKSLRRDNPLFSAIWDNQSIQSIDINALEKIDVQGRNDFYEQTGAMRDVLQGHLLQLLALVLMPITDETPSMAEAKAWALSHILPADPAETIRAQYAGYDDNADGKNVITETFVSSLLRSSDPSWKGVDLRLTTGKALRRKDTSIVLTFKKRLNDRPADQITFELQPETGIRTTINVKQPGYEAHQRRAILNWQYDDPEYRSIDAYEQVFVDAVRGEKTLFVSEAEVLESWRIVQPLLDSWAKDTAAIEQYEKGCDGPKIPIIE